jgi:hypothetical protein
MNRSARPEARRRARALALACALASARASAARAAEPTRATEPVSAYGPRNAVFVSFFSLFGPGLTLEYERFALPPRLSVVSAIGFRKTGGDDFSTFTLTTSLEGRFWLYGRAPFSRLGDRAMVGPFLAFREDVAWTSVHDEVADRRAGGAIEIAETLSAGYRVTIWRVELTLSQGVTLTTQLDPRSRLAPTTFVAAKLAGTFGALF